MRPEDKIERDLYSSEAAVIAALEKRFGKENVQWQHEARPDLIEKNPYFEGKEFFALAVNFNVNGKTAWYEMGDERPPETDSSRMYLKNISAALNRALASSLIEDMSPEARKLNHISLFAATFLKPLDGAQ